MKKTAAVKKSNDANQSSAKRLNPHNLSLLTQGVAKLINGQQRFAEQFGIALSKDDQALTADNLAAKLDDWLRSGKRGEDNIQQLIKVLYHHQLALINALDGVALRAIDYLYHETDAVKFKQRVVKLLQKDSKRKQMIADFKSDEQLRYQHIIAPGLVDYYLLAQEKLTKEDS